MLKLLFGAAIGAGAAWFLDPNHGPRRRDMVRDKTLKYTRESTRRAAREASYAASTLKGKAAAVAPGDSRAPASERLNDPALQAKIESEVFRDGGDLKGRVSINVEEGIAWLRGEVADRETIDRLRDATARVDGVRGVESLLHTPGEPAPTKNESHTTAGTSG
jgi:osmotically-inducible protein OsmY